MLIMLLIYTVLALFGASLALYGSWRTYKEKNKPSLRVVLGLMTAAIFLIVYTVLCAIYLPGIGTL